MQTHTKHLDNLINENSFYFICWICIKVHGGDVKIQDFIELTRRETQIALKI